MDSGGGPLIGSVIFAVLLLIDFLFSGYGSAVMSISDAVLDQEIKNGRKNAKQAHDLKENPRDFIHACWLYGLIASAVGTVALIFFMPWPEWGSAVCSVVSIYLLGRSIPRLLGKKYAVGWCMGLYSPISYLMKLVFPVTFVLESITRGIMRIAGTDPKDLEDEVTEDEIISMVNEGHEQGVLDEHEAEMIQNIFELDDKEAQDIMTHRKNISGIDGSLNLMEAISQMVEETNSRFPVYEGDIDNIIGVLHFKDAMIFHNKKEYDNWLIKDIPGLLRPVRFIPETRSISLLFRSMQAQKMQMVIVVDEYGETAGLVTMEDILEEIVGNILDEYDEDERFIFPQDDGSFRMDGMTPLHDVEEALGITFEEEDYETLNGYLVYRLDRIPGENEHSTIEEQGYSFQILEVENKTIRWVRVARMFPAEEVSQEEQERQTEQEKKDRVEKE